MNKNKNSSMRLDWITLIISLVAAFLYHFAGDLLMSVMYLNGCPRPLITAVYFLGLGLVLILVLIISNSINRYRSPSSKNFSHAFIALGVVAVLAAGFEGLYDLNFSHNGANASSYIFVIDDSASMYATDPTGEERTKAIQASVQDLSKNFPVCVYKFGGDAEKLTDTFKVKDLDNYSFAWTSDYDTTDYSTSLNTVLNDIASGAIEDVGNSPVILFMSDGEWDFDTSYINTILTRAAGLGVRVDTVGLGENEFGMLEFIADKTGGAFTTAENVSDLANAFREVLTTAVAKDRMLLTARGITNCEWLYAIERILFLMILGALFFFIKGELVRQTDAQNDTDNLSLIMVIIYAVVLALGAACIEVGMNMFGWSPSLSRFILCVSFLLIITFTGKNTSDPKKTKLTGKKIVVNQNAGNGFGNNDANSPTDQWGTTSGNYGWENSNNNNSGWNNNGNGFGNNGGFGGPGNGWQ